jgi:hypothetical protein
LKDKRKKDTLVLFTKYTTIISSKPIARLLKQSENKQKLLQAFFLRREACSSGVTLTGHGSVCRD